MKRKKKLTAHLVILIEAKTNNKIRNTKYREKLPNSC